MTWMQGIAPAGYPAKRGSMLKGAPLIKTDDVQIFLGPGAGKPEHWAFAFIKDGAQLIEVYKELYAEGLHSLMDQPGAIGAQAVAVVHHLGIPVSHLPD